MSSIKNIAIIMDGNGRWANERRRPRIWGHVRGSSKVSEIVKKACQLNLDSLTLYAFSTENWSRPSYEVNLLFKLLKKFLIKERKSIIKNNIQFNVIGNYKILDTEIVNLIDDLRAESVSNTGLILNIAVNYGGRSEIIDAVNSFVKMNPGKEIHEEDISNNLYNSKVKDIDLLIRTAGDCRVSNFLLWQLSYSEFFFSRTKWPDFSAQEFEDIINLTGNRERRFGGVLQDHFNEQSYSLKN